MMHLFINGLGASAGGGLTYLENVLPHLSRPGLRATVAVSSEFRTTALQQNVDYVRIPCTGGAARRFWFEQTQLPETVRRSGADVLLSAGNFALRKSPVPQILLSRNSLYTCPHFSRDLIRRREYRMWMENRIRSTLAKRSLRWAEVSVAPTQAFAHELESWTSHSIVSLHHGFDHEFFVSGEHPLSENVRRMLDAPPGTLRLLHVSHYNYYRNFETLFHAIAALKEQPGTPEIRLFLTCELEKSKTPGAYNPASARNLIDRLGIREQVVELGAIPYTQLHHAYRACDVYVTAAYTETFAHPLVEAMSCGLPIVASDLPVHREICADAAVFFPRFAPHLLAASLHQLVSSEATRIALGLAGRERARAFSWKAHVERLIELADELLRSPAQNRAQAHSMSAA